VLVVDAAILVAAAGGRSSGALTEANNARVLITTDRAVEEARRRIELGMKRPELLPIVDALAAMMAVVPADELGVFILAAEQSLRDAVASRNGPPATLTSSPWRGRRTPTSGRPTATSPAPAPPPGPRRT
jgi:hypothetical protein